MKISIIGSNKIPGISKLDIKGTEKAKKKYKILVFSEILVTVMAVVMSGIALMKLISVGEVDLLEQAKALYPSSFMAVALWILEFGILRDIHYRKYSIKKSIFAQEYLDAVIDMKASKLKVTTEDREHVVREQTQCVNRIIVNGITEPYFDICRMAVCVPYKQKGESDNG